MNSFLPPHQRYGYSAIEQLLMLLVTGVTNFGGIPVTIYLYKSKKIFESYITAFTVLTSFMYHALDSLDCPRFFLTEQQWHILDNIGSISSFMIVFIHLMDNRNAHVDFQLYLGAFTIALLAQFRAPWNILYTVVPIGLAVTLMVGSVLIKRKTPKLNFKALFKALVLVLIAILCFSKGLDEDKDYLRIFHGLWHLNIFLACYYIWHAKVPVGREVKLISFWKQEEYETSFSDTGSMKEYML